jgi:putative ABC transport system ATP-binding protein
MPELCDLVKLYLAVAGETARALTGVAVVAPNSGPVLVDGRDISSLSDQRRGAFRLSQLGVVRQSFNLLQGISGIDKRHTKPAREHALG